MTVQLDLFHTDASDITQQGTDIIANITKYEIEE